MALSKEQIIKRKFLFRPCKSRQELHDWVLGYLDLDLPGVQVDEDSNSSPLDMVWECYSHLMFGGDEDMSRILYYASRAGGKSLSESVIEVLLLLHFRSDIIHLAAIEQQSLDVQGYIKHFFSKPYLEDFVQGDNKRTTSAVFYVPNKMALDRGGYTLSLKEYKALPPEEKINYRFISNKVEVIVATMASVNGKHGILIMDELDVLDKPKVLAQAVNIPTPCKLDDGTIRLPLTILTSTRKTAFGLVQNEIDKPENKRPQIRHWNILDVTEKCPTTRHEPDKPKVTIYRSDKDLSSISEEKYLSLTPEEQKQYIKATGYHGCLNRCKMFAVCRGRLATKQTSDSSFLKPVLFTQNQFKDNDIDTAHAELLCWKPSSGGLIYPRFEQDKHVINPNVAYEIITGQQHEIKRLSKDQLMSWASNGFANCWFGGMDFGFGHSFVYVHGLIIRKIVFILGIVAIPELEPNQQLLVTSPYKEVDPLVYPDTENPQMVKVFRSQGWRMARWGKGKDSVIGGISIVKLKLTPTLGGSPEMYFVRDYGSDPFMDLGIKHFREHHWKLDAAGNASNIVSDTNKDIPDAIRYLVMNRFSPKGEIVSPEDEKKEDVHYDSSGRVSYQQDIFIQQKVAEILGLDKITVEELRPIQDIQERNTKSYYAQMNEKKKFGQKDKKGGLIWDLS